MYWSGTMKLWNFTERNFQFWRWSPLFRLPLSCWCVPAPPCFVVSHETIQNFLRIAVKWSHDCAYYLESPTENLGTYYTDSVLMSKISAQIWVVPSFVMLNVSAILSIFNSRNVNTRSWTFVTLCRASDYGYSKIGVRPWWNSLNEFLIVVIEVEESPYIALKHFLISLCLFPYKIKYPNINWYCCFSIFLKSVEFEPSTCGPKKTASSIRLTF